MTLLRIGDVLAPEVLHDITAMIPSLTWKDGRGTAGGRARAVKVNEQADLSSGAGLALKTRITDALVNNEVLKAAANPRRFASPLLSRTRNGGHYGRHIDNALMGNKSDRLRTDLSYTLFLSPPDSYEGGELVLYSPSGEQKLKLSPGEMVLYPSGDIHEVLPVTSGERIVVVGWIESFIADPHQRSLLFDLYNIRASMRARKDADLQELLTLEKTIANLMRMWASF